MSSKSAQRWLSLFLTLFLISLSSCATSASGPTAYYSIAAAAPYSTLRPCAASCLVYRGSLTCLNKGYYDLSAELACGCNPQNSCYCDANFGAKASLYISSCVSKGCGADFPGEVTSAMDLYNGYCATANVAAAVQTSALGVTTSTSAKSTPAANLPNSNLDPNANAKNPVSSSSGAVTIETPTPSGSSATSKNKGLAQSDVIALAVGLGVGLPSLVLALATFCLQRRKRERQHRPSPEVHYVHVR